MRFLGRCHGQIQRLLTSGGPLNWSARGALGSRSSTVRQRRLSFAADDAQAFSLAFTEPAGAEAFAFSSIAWKAGVPWRPEWSDKDQSGASAGGSAPRPMRYGFETTLSEGSACPVPAVQMALLRLTVNSTGSDSRRRTHIVRSNSPPGISVLGETGAQREVAAGCAGQLGRRDDHDIWTGVANCLIKAFPVLPYVLTQQGAGRHFAGWDFLPEHPFWEGFGVFPAAGGGTLSKGGLVEVGPPTPECTEGM